MNIESVTAHDFGPLHDQRLELRPGMNVVFGLNEAGKSSWHTALYVGLCGMRRQRNKEVDALRDRYHPWDRARWSVSAVIRLADGRRVNLIHDLESRTGQAMDLSLGRDVSNEILFEGAIDGSVWLDLNRRVFIATACIRQADLLAVLEEPKVLQEHLQRAADTAGGEGTAAKALAILDKFRQDRVGAHQANAKGPLRQARDRVQQAEARLAEAQRQHEAYLELAERVEEADFKTRDLEHELRLLEARLARDEADEWRRRAQRARSLHELHPTGPPPSPSAESELAQQTMQALAAWELRPSVPPLDGPDSAALREQIAALPGPPEGDLEVSQEIRASMERLHDVGSRLRAHMALRPPEPAPVVADGATGEELIRLADQLEIPDPPIDHGVEERISALQREVDGLPERRGSRLGVALGAGSVLAGALLLFAGAVALGLGVVCAGLALAVWAWPRLNQDRLRKELALISARQALGQHAVEADLARRTRDAAKARLADLGLTLDPEELRRLAARIYEAGHARDQYTSWAERARALNEEQQEAEAHLATRLSARGAPVEGDPLAAFAAYEQACDQRRRQAEQAALRTRLEQQLQFREEQERAARKAEQACDSAARELRAAGVACGCASVEEEALARELRSWLEGHKARVEALEHAHREWAELQTLLDGRSLALLEDEARRRVEDAASKLEGLDPVAVQAVEVHTVDRQIEELRRQLSAAREQRDLLRGQLKTAAREAGGVAEAEEGLELARAELHRVEELERVIERTREFLRRAQERSHQAIAPALVETVEAWLPQVTHGRYTEALVDPEHLNVQVRSNGGTWRPATSLSHGTAEQVYLLLRVALAERLARPGEPCPLLLDDVTVQTDSRRTRAILEALHALSDRHQIVLFTQEEEVLAWARDNLNRAEQHRLIELPEPALPW